jgi:hypothetical protein
MPQTVQSRIFVTSLTGDRWGGEFVRERFESAGLKYEISERVKSDIYKELLPLLNSGRAELLDIARLTTQLCNLERRTARGGKDSIDHAPGAHDDGANAVAGAIVLASASKRAMKISDDVLARAARPGLYQPRNF